MTPQELKNSILQLAIQGKLVEQRPEEGTGEELYQKIQAEKQKLIKAGKLKKEKPLPEIAEDEVPFDIPESWKWVRLGNVCSKVVDGDHNPPSGSSNQTDYVMLSAKNINNNRLVQLDDARYLSKETFIKEDERTNVRKDDIFLTTVATLGRSCVYQGGYNICFQRSVTVITTLILNYFLKYVFDSPYVQNIMNRDATGTAQKGFYLKQLVALPVPIPPLDEQKRIVAKIEELLPLVERYGEAWTKLEEFNRKFPDDMQKSILQQAIQGKLVEQRPEEGTGEKLYQQIQAEKQKLIKEGKLKKEKPLPEITEGEIPFEIPENWKWARLNDIVIKTIKRGKSPTYIAKSNTLVFAQKCNTKAGRIDLSLAQYLDESKLGKYPAEEFMHDGDIVINSTGNGTLGRVGIYTNNDNPDGLPIVPDSHVTVIRVNKDIDRLFIFYGLKYYQPFMEKLGSGSTNQTELSASIIQKMLFPIPPLAEQKRIVARIEEILPLCDKLK